MTGWTRIYLDAVVSAGVSGGTKIIPFIDPEGQMVESAVGASEKGDVMGRMSSLEKGGELVAIIGENLLGETKFEHFSEEARDAIDVFAQQEDVVEARWMHTLQVRRSGWRVDQREAIADL